MSYRTKDPHFRAIAAMDKVFGLGVAEAHEIIGRDSVVKRIYDCAIVALRGEISASDDMAVAVKECIDAEEARRKKLKFGAPASTYTDSRLERLRAALAKAEG